jgi:hypothetical protein
MTNPEILNRNDNGNFSANITIIFLIMVALLIIGVLWWELEYERFVERGCKPMIPDRFTIPTKWVCPNG